MNSGEPTGLPALMRRINAIGPPTDLASWWCRTLGISLTKTLVRLNILINPTIVATIRCGDSLRGDCRRRVTPAPNTVPQAYWATCTHPSGSCGVTRMSREQVTEFEFSMVEFIDLLRRLFALTGPIAPPTPNGVSPQHIGEHRGVPVFLLRAHGLRCLDAWVRCYTRAIFLVPTVRDLSSVMLAGHGHGKAVEVIVLDEVLEHQGDTFRVHWPPLPPPQVSAAGISSPTLTEVFVREVYAHDGQRKIGRAEYEELRERGSTYDLFLDQTDSATDSSGNKDGQRRPGWSRPPGQEALAVSLTKHETDAIVELVRAGRPLRATEFTHVDVTAIGKVVEHARKAIDIKLGARSWRAIHTSGDGRDKMWEFRPPTAMRWAVICHLRP